MKSGDLMSMLASLVALLSSSTARSIGEFVLEKVRGYLNAGKEINEDEKTKLQDQIRELERINSSLENKLSTVGADTQSEVNDLKQEIISIETLQKKLPETMISIDSFNNWIDQRELEEQAYVAHKRLEVLNEKAREVLSQNKRWEIQDVQNNLFRYAKNLIKARKDWIGHPTIEHFHQEVQMLEIAVQNNLALAKDLITKYKNLG